MRGKVKMQNNELVIDDDADDLFSIFARACRGVIKIHTPFGKFRFKKNKSNNRIMRVGHGRN